MATLKPPCPNLSRIVSRLPEEIINIIFSKLSVKDILKLRSVCKLWLSVISSPCFVKAHEMIMHNIFLRLPVKTLLMSSSVCKSWLSVISSRDFIKAHLHVSTHDPHFTYHRLILIEREHVISDAGLLHQYLSFCSAYSLIDHEPYIKRQFDFATSFIDELLNEPAEDHIKNFVVGYCNGLVCLASGDKNLFFYNPSTRESRRLPKPDMIDHYRSTETCYGFCYDETNDDFKVFVIFPCLPYYCKRESKVWVYSSKSDCWRLIGDFPFRAVWSEGAFANGAMHWAVKGDRENGTIVSLDITTEEYREILLPKHRKGAYSGWTLDTFGESLSILSEFQNIGRVDFWVMRKSGVEESWTKLFSIPYNINGVKMHTWHLKPIRISMNGDILLKLGSRILLYSSQDNTLKNVMGAGFFDSIDVFTYVESLVSPHF